MTTPRLRMAPAVRHARLVPSTPSWHRRALAIYLLVVAGHFTEHVVQLLQVLALGLAPADAGGLLGERFVWLARSEVLHTAYNSLQLTGLILLAPGFASSGRARGWWTAALVAQSWHWLEHAFLQVQFATGVYFYGAIKQMSVLERFFPRIELHFAYNLLVVVPTVIAVVLYLRSGGQASATREVRPRRRAPRAPIRVVRRIATLTKEDS